MFRARVERKTVGGATLVTRHLTLTVAGARSGWGWSYSQPLRIEMQGLSIRIHDHVLYLKLITVMTAIAAWLRRRRS